MPRVRSPYADPIAHETRIHDALPLVEALSRLFARRYRAERDELVSVGHEAVVHAARSYDARRGVAFSAYAWLRIRFAMLEHVRREAIRRRLEAERGTAVPLDAASPHEPDMVLAETIAGDAPDMVERAVEARHALQLVAALPEREREALTRAVRGEGDAEIAAALGVSPNRAWQLHQRAAQRVRTAA